MKYGIICIVFHLILIKFIKRNIELFGDMMHGIKSGRGTEYVIKYIELFNDVVVYTILYGKFGVLKGYEINSDEFIDATEREDKLLGIIIIIIIIGDIY